MDWLLAALLAMGCGVITLVTDKYVVSRIDPKPYTFLIGAVGLLSFFVLPFGTTTPTLWQWLGGIALGILFAYSVYTAFVAYQRDEISRFAPLNMLSTIVITIGAALFFNEHLSGQQYAAFILFLIGAFFLATRIETKVLFEGKGSWGLDELPALATRTITDPVGEGIKATKQLGMAVDRVVTDWINAAKDPSITWIRLTRKVRFIKGLGWYLLSLALYVPYVLLSKELNGSVGVINGWVAIRLGLFIGAVLIMVGHWAKMNDLRSVKITTISIIKEFFGMAGNYLILYAMFNGVTGIVQSMFAIEAVGVFIVGSILAYFGVIKESLAKRDLIQKTVGVFFVAAATVLLFL